MWNNFKNIASEAYEAAREIKQHVSEVTSGEYDFEEEPEKLRRLHAESQLERALEQLQRTASQLDSLQASYSSEKDHWESRLQKLLTQVSNYEELLQTKDREIHWQAQQYSEQINSLISAKNLALAQVSELTETKDDAKSLAQEQTELKNQVEEMQKQIWELSKTNEHLKKELKRSRQLLDDQQKAESEKIDRSFIIQTFGAYNRNLTDFGARVEILEKLALVLKLSEEEREMLGLPKNQPTQQVPEPGTSLVKMFQDFISES